jgi:hypothetical protein
MASHLQSRRCSNQVCAFIDRRRRAPRGGNLGIIQRLGERDPDVF